MNAALFAVSWVDFAAVLVVMVGVMRGRRRGMSEELLDVLKWLIIVLLAAYAYEPAGSIMSAKTPFSRLSCFVAVYVGIILIVHVLFMMIRRQVGDKLVGSDAFGSTEYYLGMAAGGFRYTCVMIVVLALLNARYYSPEEIQSRDAFQERNYGSHFFPTMYGFQKEVFERAWVGKLPSRHASFLLIRRTAPEEKGLDQSGIARARESYFNEVLKKR